MVISFSFLLNEFLYEKRFNSLLLLSHSSRDVDCLPPLEISLLPTTYLSPSHADDDPSPTPDDNHMLTNTSRCSCVSLYHVLVMMHSSHDVTY